MAKDKNDNNRSFVLHDESVNTLGFRMLTSGADLSEFIKNPVMFYCHKDWELPIGRWENIRIDGTQILADPVFDEEDEEALKIKSKVDQGFLRAVSIGAWPPLASSSEPALMLPGQELPTITKWVVREASICPIGRNHNALRMYDRSGKEVNLNDRSQLIQLFDGAGSNTHNMFHPNNNNMHEVAKLLNLSDSASGAAIAEEVKKIIALKDSLKAKTQTLEAENVTLSDKVKEYEKKKTEEQKAEAIKLTDAAIKDGRINADGRTSWLEDFESNFERTKIRLSSIAKRTPISSHIQQCKGGSSTGVQLSDMSFSDIVKADRLKELKSDQELYREKFFEAYGRYPA